MYYVFCDGGAAPTNPGPTACGVVIRTPEGSTRELAKFCGHGTNQTAELDAAILGLVSVPEGADVILTSDSQYVIKGISEWRKGWEARGWRNANKKPISNKDRWLTLFGLVDKRNVNCNWVRGHNGHPENERCDSMVTDALISHGYITNSDEQPGS